jgi:oxygen-dependent protoporphyrinogen oxidase
MTDAGMRDVVIVGGGIGGLSGAWRLRGRDILVLEAGDRPGGRLRSEPRGDYWLNFGAHLFGEHTSPAGALADELGLQARPIPGDRMGIAFKGKVVAGGRSETFPLRLPLGLRARFSFIKMGLKLRSGVLRLLEVQKPIDGEPPAARRVRQLSFENARTLADYVGPLTPDVELMLRTITERTAADPSAMAAGYGLTSFGQVWSTHSFGRNLFGGSSRLPQAIASALGARLQLNAEVISVEAMADHVEIAYRQNGAEHIVRARHAIVATPAPVSCRILKGIPDDTAQALGQIRYGAFLSAAVLTGETGPMPWDENYAIATPGLSFGVFFNQASTLRVGARKPGGSLMLFRGARGAAELMKLTDAEIAASFQADLEKLFPQARGIVREIVVQRWPLGAPYSFPGRAALQPALTRDLGRVQLAGDYLEFPCMDAAIATAEEAAAKIAAALEPPPPRAGQVS